MTKNSVNCNILFYGQREDLCSSAILELVQKDENVRYYRWSIPLSDELFKTLGSKISAKSLATGHKSEASDLDQLRNSQGRKVIVVENIHLLAQGARDMSEFYRQLLSECNYYHIRHDIYFMLSCRKVPTAFIKENPLPQNWRFVACDDSKRLNRSLEREFILLRKRHPELEPHHFRRLKETLDRFQADKSRTDQLARRLIESSDQFKSEAYWQPAGDELRSRPPAGAEIVEHLKSIVIGQDRAIQKLSDAIMLSYYSLPEPEDSRPRAVYLFVGGSGVGKTRICQELSRILPGYRFLQINMAEYGDRSGVNKLIGLGRGYEDSRMGGVLTEPIRLWPRHVVLFDELDHASSTVSQLFYKIFDGEIMDGRGRAVSFRDCFIVLTTNKGQTLDTVPVEQQRKSIEKKLIEDNAEMFTPAFMGRIHSMIQFSSLSTYELMLIAERYFDKRILKVYGELGISVEFQPNLDIPGLLHDSVFHARHLFYELIALLASSDKEQGARRLFQIMDEQVVQPLELYRIKYLNNADEKSRIRITFDPFWPDDCDLNYDQATVLLVDDDLNAADTLRNLLSHASSIQVAYNNFDPDGFVTEGVALVLLDLYKDKKDYGRIFLELVRKKIEAIPVCIYSALGQGPKLERLKAGLWQYNITDYYEKSSNDLLPRIYSQIHRFYLEKKAKSDCRITQLNMEPPTKTSHEIDLDFTWKT